jgi:hypothetical protein
LPLKTPPFNPQQRITEIVGDGITLREGTSELRAKRQYNLRNFLKKFEGIWNAAPRPRCAR